MNTVRISIASKNIHQNENKIKNVQGFPGDAMVKNPPANAGVMGSSPGPGRSHMPQSN